MIKIAKILAFLALLWIVAGLAIYPAWWYSFVFEGKYADSQYWWSGVYAAVLYNWEGVVYFVVLVGAILALSRTSVPDRLQRASTLFWTTGVVGKRFVATVLVA